MTIYRFGRCVVHPAWRTVEIDGRPAAIGARAFDVLAALIEHRDRVLSKAELMELAWPGRVIEENNLEVQICMLRKAIGAGAIATLARRGYRFAAPLAEDADVPRPGGSVPPAALPSPRRPLLGRAEELAALVEQLAAHRVVTVVGAGGIGKTALASAAAHAIAAQPGRRVHWIDLTGVRDVAQLLEPIAGALGLPLDVPADALGDAVADLLAAGDRLLVLDNAGRFAGAVARLIADLLDRATTVRWLVTSQGRLGLAGERVLRLDPLAVPDAAATPAQAMAHGAVALFADAAQAYGAAFVLDGRTVGDVIDICRRLDGLPLAIELAAARLPLLGLDGLRSGLDRRFELLASTDRVDRPDRQATLRASLEWTCGLLEPSAQRAFRRLGVCVGGVAYDVALALIDVDADPQAAMRDLDALIDRSLIVADTQARPRYRMLESTRLLALERLREAGETDVAEARLCAAMTARCDAIVADFIGESDRVLLARHAPELDNLRAALAWAGAHDPQAAVTLAAAFACVGSMLSLTVESLAHLERTAPLLAACASPLWAARWQVARAQFARSQRLDDVLDGLRSAIATLRGLQRTIECLHATAAFALSARKTEVAEAAALLDLARGLVPDDAPAMVLLHVALAEYGVAIDRDGVDEQRHWLSQIRVLAAAAGHDHATHLAHWNLGWLAALHGDPEEGAAMARAILAAVDDAAPNLTRLANGLALLLTALLDRGQLAEARGVARRLAALGMPLRRTHEFADGWAWLCALAGDGATAARLVGFADAQAGRLTSRRDRLGRMNRDRAFERASARLGAVRAGELARQGALLAPAQIEPLLAAAIDAPPLARAG
ncbi:MAG: winged helix-turn-helix domain-containing protein [Proteobacteria bacterium]|nr:winged helix-turn-helix domain-containing protein [Pseudomonadota bacterium]